MFFLKIQGGDPQKRNENDAAALQAKVAAKQAEKDAAAGVPASSKAGPIAPKKVKKDTAVVDDLLLAGLNTGKKKAVGAK